MSVRNVPVAETRFLLREYGGGDGTPVVLLHGVPETSSAWHLIALGLADGRRVLCPDLPGLGGSAYSGPYDVASVTGQLMALLDAELPGQRVDLAGHDWGGVLALAMAGAYPERFRSLCVANAPFRKVSVPRMGYAGFFSLPFAPEGLFKVGGRRVVELMFRAAWKSDRELDPEVMAEYTAAYTDPGKVRAMLGYYRAAARPQVAAALTRAKPAAPPQPYADRMLVLWGAQDPVLPVWVGESVVKDLGASCSMITVPSSGHFVLEEAPEVCLSSLRDLFADPPAPKKRAPRQK